jgi:hypothetical protein
MCPGRSLSLYFPHQFWMDHPGRYTADIRGAYQALDMRLLGPGVESEELWGHTWVFDVAKTFSDAGVADDVLLEFSGLETAPEGAHLYFVDHTLGRVVDLRDETSYSFHSGTRRYVEEDDARFSLLVGSSEFIDQHEGDLPGLPVHTALHKSYPNPFTSSTIIRYDLAWRDDISLRIYDATGGLVRVLYQGPRGPGRYEAVWLGDNNHGGRAATGIYFCYLQTSEGVGASRKLLLIR